MDTKEFIDRFKFIFGDKYDVSNVEYINSHSKVSIICPVHGEFWAEPHNLLKGRGCPKCAGKYKTTDDIIREFKDIHGNKYNYSKVVYTKAKDKVCIICPIHGEFWQSPNHHLRGDGCPLCAGKGMTVDELKRRCKQMYGDNISLDKAIYKSAKEKIIVTCKKHGDFEITPDNLLRGHSCPKCKSSLLENDIREMLLINNIPFISQCRNNELEWLNSQSLDFYLPEHKIAIECQGEQHFKPIDYFGGYDGFAKRLELDRIKYKNAKENGIKIIYYATNKRLPKIYFDKIYRDKGEILREIIK